MKCFIVISQSEKDITTMTQHDTTVLRYTRMRKSHNYITCHLHNTISPIINPYTVEVRSLNCLTFIITPSFETVLHTKYNRTLMLLENIPMLLHVNPLQPSGFYIYHLP
jgi:hypothetical protein